MKNIHRRFEKERVGENSRPDVKTDQQMSKDDKSLNIHNNPHCVLFKEDWMFIHMKWFSRPD